MSFGATRQTWPDLCFLTRSHSSAVPPGNCSCLASEHATEQAVAPRGGPGDRFGGFLCGLEPIVAAVAGRVDSRQLRDWGGTGNDCGKRAAAGGRDHCKRGVFKYAGFFADTFSGISGIDWAVTGIALPLAISFFTFQQIAFLVDTYRGVIRENSLRRYFLFVSFFPQLIAGPIVRHEQMASQLGRNLLIGLTARNLAVGLTIIAFGLGKKSDSCRWNCRFRRSVL